MQSYSIVSSILALSIRILSSKRALGRSYSSRVNFRKLHHVAYAPVDLDRQVGIVISVPPMVYELVRLIVHIAMDFGLSFARKRITSIFASYTVRPNAAHTIPISPVIFLSCSRSVSSA